MNALAVVDPEIAREKARKGDLDGAIELARTALDDMFDRARCSCGGLPLRSWWNHCLARGADGDLQKRKPRSTG